jgi:pyruvate/2-oxoglutarate dehydrogenase complex dihydrolipoamide acyltransferase (E2) component|tara:strand:+ start:369 stop:644 length:276 start_codon:yes stop_codon:yes gene_type:complete
MQNILMPKWGLSIHEAKILKWNFSTNDFVKEGQELCEIETDKTTSVYESPYTGYLVKIIVNNEEICSVGNPIAIISDKIENENTINSFINN